MRRVLIGLLVAVYLAVAGVAAAQYNWLTTHGWAVEYECGQWDAGWMPTAGANPMVAALLTKQEGGYTKYCFVLFLPKQNGLMP